MDQEADPKFYQSPMTELAGVTVITQVCLAITSTRRFMWIHLRASGLFTTLFLTVTIARGLQPNIMFFLGSASEDFSQARALPTWLKPPHFLGQELTRHKRSLYQTASNTLIGTICALTES